MNPQNDIPDHHPDDVARLGTRDAKRQRVRLDQQVEGWRVRGSQAEPTKRTPGTPGQTNRVKVSVLSRVMDGRYPDKVD